MLANLLPSLIAAPTADAATVKSRLVVPPGYGISIFARDIPDARVLRVTAHGDLLVASPARVSVLWLARDTNGDGESDDRRRAARRSRRAERSGFPGRLSLRRRTGPRLAGCDSTMRPDASTASYEIVIKGLPVGGNHWKKTIRFGPDGLLYLNIGSSCNVCLEAGRSPRGDAALYAGRQVRRHLCDGSAQQRRYGLARRRYPVRDRQRSRSARRRFPAVRVERDSPGGFYGWPFANGDRVPDPDFGAGRAAVIAASIPPVFDFRAHNAPLGIVFLRSDKQLPDVSRRCTRCAARFVEPQSQGRLQSRRAALGCRRHRFIRSDFLTGFLEDENVIGRPAEVAEDADGGSMCLTTTPMRCIGSFPAGIRR